MLLNLSFTTDYTEIGKGKQKSSDANAHKENTKSVKHENKVNDQVLKDRRIFQCKLSPKRDGPYQVV